MAVLKFQTILTKPFAKLLVYAFPLCTLAILLISFKQDYGSLQKTCVKLAEFTYFQTSFHF